MIAQSNTGEFTKVMLFLVECALERLLNAGKIAE